jgi:hydroxymethylbilane synthase
MALLLRLGTRGSRLALWQANHVAGLLQPWCGTEIIEIETAGDQVRDVPLAQIGGQGVFTKEIQRAVLDGRVSVAVHSLKDLPTEPAEKLALAAVPRRGPAGDVLISPRHRNFDSLPVGATVGTSSLRRRAQIQHRRPDLRVVPVRGNVETRLRKLDEKEFDALVLAEAGLERLGLHGRIAERLDPSWMLPAVGQGALGLECRADAMQERELLGHIDDAATHQAVLAERALLRTLEGGCQVPIGASGHVQGPRLTLRATVLDPQGQKRFEASISGSAEDAEELGRQLAVELLGRGARELLKSAYKPEA